MESITLPLDSRSYEKLPIEIFNYILPTLLGYNNKQDTMKALIKEDGNIEVYINNKRKPHLDHNPAIKSVIKSLQPA